MLGERPPFASYSVDDVAAARAFYGETLGLDVVEESDLDGYQPAHAARAELCRRLGRTSEARSAYATALALTDQGPQRRILERRLAEIGDDGAGG